MAKHEDEFALLMILVGLTVAERGAMNKSCEIIAPSYGAGVLGGFPATN